MAKNHPWYPLKENSKKIKLPKSLWVKGKSKFLYIRLHDEGKRHINQLYAKKSII